MTSCKICQGGMVHVVRVRGIRSPDTRDAQDDRSVPIMTLTVICDIY